MYIDFTQKYIHVISLCHINSRNKTLWEQDDNLLNLQLVGADDQVMRSQLGHLDSRL